MRTEKKALESLKCRYGHWKDLVLFTKEEYRNTKLSEENKQILCDMGLPEKPLEFLSFDLNKIDNIKLDEEHIIIGNDYGTKICINKNDEIVSVDEEGEYATRYVNSSLSKLLAFIEIYDCCEARFDNISDEEAGFVINEVKRKFNEVDAKALSDEENWWSVILEQVEQGLM